MSTTVVYVSLFVELHIKGYTKRSTHVSPTPLWIESVQLCQLPACRITCLYPNRTSAPTRPLEPKCPNYYAAPVIHNVLHPTQYFLVLRATIRVSPIHCFVLSETEYLIRQLQIDVLVTFFQIT